MKKPGIPDPKSPRFALVVKERLEILSGERSEKIKLLDPQSATTADIASKINELIDLLQ